ncbi:ABC transporter ATP-binding protein [Bacillus suaedae]|uniref:ATP-binding cassette domain-containing protein n=1 Tax=Halalkalibacter suaedae TaxID=2822140 RepID=A0A941AQB9_9BACI|nr:ATP-binding cassette domain-containing protein [Bacillus suaedae]MBP3952467.1 ATP-binding cassette domain-containing protein [Bacillus suaedae]
MAYIQLKNIKFTYPDMLTPALKDVSLDIERGQFVVLFGPSGCGKSTLLKLLKKDIQPHGIFEGECSFNGVSVKDRNDSNGEIGFVFQDPENQVVADEVLHELVFGLENIGLPTSEMRNRVAEMVHFIGAESLLTRKTHELSGGQKQQLNLASILLMQPNVLLLDEPTAQLDPVSAREFLDMLVRLNEEFGMTIIMAEHRLEEVMTVADKVVMMEKGSILAAGKPEDVIRELWGTKQQPFIPSIPSFVLSLAGKQTGFLPLSVKKGRKWLEGQTLRLPQQAELKGQNKDAEIVVEMKNVFYQYNEKNTVLTKVDFTLKRGEMYALLGGNGSGKTTLLKIMNGILKPQKGKVFLFDKQLKSWKNRDIVQRIGYLPQNPKLFFIQDTVAKEIKQTMQEWAITSKQEVTFLIDSLGLTDLLDKHPYDLSGGELQKAALACLLLRKPDILLLDEPTKGLDPISKQQLIQILLSLQSEGMTMMMTTHDVEFAAKYATTCGMMFQGHITTESQPQQFFKGNFFYTTMIQRLFRGVSDEIVTLGDVHHESQDH